MAYPLFYYSLLNPAPLSAISATGFRAADSVIRCFSRATLLDLFLLFAPVAQWIEQWFPKPLAGCPIHPGGTIKSSSYEIGQGLLRLRVRLLLNLFKNGYCRSLSLSN